jgi:hypothetical protein
MCQAPQLSVAREHGAIQSGDMATNSSPFIIDPNSFPPLSGIFNQLSEPLYFFNGAGCTIL